MDGKTKYELELERWQRPAGWRPEAHQYPRMLYRARFHPRPGRAVVILPGDDVADQQFSSQNCMTVQNEDEERRVVEQGWRRTPQEALDLFEGREKSKADADAERAYADRNMSDPAKREIAEARAGLDQAEHMPEVPQKRGRRKQAAA